MAHARSVYQQGVEEASPEREYQHDGIVETERPHGRGTVEGTLALAEILVGLQQAAVVAVYILDDILVTAVRKTVDERVAVARVELADEFPLAGNGETIVHMECEQELSAIISVVCEGGVGG